MLLRECAELMISGRPHLGKEALLSLASLIASQRDSKGRVHDDLLQTPVSECESGSRRDADVVVCALFRKYTRFRGTYDNNYVEGMTFWTADGTQIINYPKLHSENCTTKHQGTNQWFKPMVRIVKNMRNRMIDANYIREGLAPSYFIEGLLYNVPNGNFGSSYANTFAAAINWLLKADRSQMVCANDQYYLLNPTSPVTWRAEECDAFINALVKFWNAW